MVSVHVIDGADGFEEALTALSQGAGPLAIDAERASGFTYSQRAYLIQVYRRDAGTFLFDPPAIGDMSALGDVGASEEWVLHAASQDLACIREVGVSPQKIFDTELAARLLGIPRVGLGTVLAELLDVHLAKEHSAVDWSTRPLPEPWLAYASEDVEHLVNLRDTLSELLEEQGKSDIAAQEFQATLDRMPKPPADEPWRRTSGIHALRQPRQLAVARALWNSRDSLARERDISPGRLIPDAAIVAAASADLATSSDLAGLKSFTGRASRSELARWWRAIGEGLTATELPQVRVSSEGTPHPRSWPDKNPEAAERLRRARASVTDLAEEMNIPAENLLTPALVRDLCWAPPEPLDVHGVTAFLAAGGARAWQVEATSEMLFRACLPTPSQPDTQA